MATKTEEFLTGTGTTIGFTTQYINESDIKVRVDGGNPLTFIGTTGTPTTGQYKIAANSTTITFGDNQNGKSLHIYSETDVTSPTVTFTPGSSIKAADLNALETLVRHGIQESRNDIIEQDLRDGQVTSAKILDGTIVNADINASADIANSKIADGLLKSGITVNSANIVDGSIVNADVSNSANIDGSKIADSSIASNKLSSGALPSGITVASANIVDGTIVDADIATGTLDNRYYTETELDAGQLDNRYFTETELNNGQLNNQYYTETELDGGQLDNRYFTETELNPSANAGQNVLDTRYFTETELTGGALDGRYYTETEAEAKFLRQDSSETIASGVTWSNSDAFVATTAAINARIIDLVDEVGGFTVIATELVFPNTNPQGATGQAAILSIGALTQAYTPSGTTVTIANGTVGNSTVTITGVPSALPQGFGLLVESTSTLNTYTFHRLVPKATEVTTVASNITNISAAGANVVDINNFADLYQIGGSAPTQRADGTSLQDGDLWFDNSSDNLRVYDGTNWAIVTPAQSVLNDIAIVSGAITYQEDLGLISDAVSTGSSNGSLDIVADALEDERTFTVTAATGKFIIDGVDKPALTLHKGWTYTFDVSDASNANHPFRFYAGSSQYSTNVTVTGTQGQAGAKVQIVIPESQPSNFQYYCTNHSGMGNTITVAEDPIKAVADIAANVVTVAGISSNVTSVANNNSNVTSVANNETNINAVQANASNINAAVSNASNINSAVSNATNINTVSSSISDVNRYANEYKISSSAPGSPSAGDLWFDTSSNTLKNYNGSAWLGITSNSGIQNVVDDTSPQLAATLDGQNNNLSNIGTIDGANLQLDFGTL